jgi:phospholipase/carboxylesterase
VSARAIAGLTAFARASALKKPCATFWLVAALAFGAACDATIEVEDSVDGHLTARPRAGVTTSAEGEHTLGLDRGRDAILHVPPNAGAEPMPLLVLLHGAGGRGEGVLGRLGEVADAAGVAVLAPDSRTDTWDAVRGKFGPDVAFIDRALHKVFDTVNVDEARVAIGGFSDGASYALSLGLINGDLFRHVVAFSPGFVVKGTRRGQPRVFMSHGGSDQILPIDRTSLLILPGLRAQGYDVTFREFDGGHEVPPAIAQEGVAWIKSSASSPR